MDLFCQEIKLAEIAAWQHLEDNISLFSFCLTEKVERMTNE